MIRHLSLASLAVLSLAACQRTEPEAAPAAPATPAAPAAPVTPIVVDPNLLTPDGIGAIRVGQTIAEVTAAAGAPNVVIEDPAGCNYFHPERAPADIFVMTQNGRVTHVSAVGKATAKTDRGFGIGDAPNAIKAAYGGAVIVSPDKYEAAPAEDLTVWTRGGSTTYVTNPEARGLVYVIGTNGKVAAVLAGGPTIQLTEICG